MVIITDFLKSNLSEISDLLGSLATNTASCSTSVGKFTGRLNSFIMPANSTEGSPDLPRISITSASGLLCGSSHFKNLQTTLSPAFAFPIFLAGIKKSTRYFSSSGITK